MSNNAQHGRGYIPDSEEMREKNRKFGAVRPSSVARATAVTFAHLAPLPMPTQGQTSRCVAYSMSEAFETRCALDGKPLSFRVSRNGLYWPARALDEFQQEDGGARISSAALALHVVGVPSEDEWPSDVATINTRPTVSTEIDGLLLADGSYERIDASGPARVEATLDALQLSCPVVLDVNADYLFDTTDTVPAPPPQEGGRTNHAIWLCGFDRLGSRVLSAHSWEDFGDRGFLWLAAEWLLYASDTVALLPKGGVSHA